MEENIFLDRNIPSSNIYILKDQPFVVLTKVEFLPLNKFSKIDFASKYLVCKIFSKSDDPINTLNIGLAFITENLYVFPQPKIINEYSGANKIEIAFPFDKNTDVKSVKLFFKRTLPLVSLDNYFHDFKNHLDDEGVTRTIFSAPFGHGKTTFLKEFFLNNNENYKVFHLFPVNYSIASNEDIFEYLKCEILFQLLEDDEIVFDKQFYSSLELLPYFVLNNNENAILNVFKAIVKLVPKVGKPITSAISSIQTFIKSFEKYKNKFNIDDKEVATNYLSSFFEKEGSLFEDNFYTQLIRQLIEQLKLKGKRTILVLDDLDRIDPEHIFRILNVFSAHFDSPTTKALNSSNKFSFDKIIMVADYDNLKKIFCHKYGEKTHFKGYIDKFYSKKIWYFDSKLIMFSLINSIIPDTLNKEIEIYKLILKDLITTKCITLRELFQLKKFNYSYFKRISIIDSNGKENYESSVIFSSPYFNNNFFIQLFYLSELAGINHAIDMIENCSLGFHEVGFSNNDIEFNYTKLYLECQISLNTNNNNFPTVVELIEFGLSKQFRVISDPFNRNKHIIIDEDLKKVNFNGKRFYEQLLKVAQKYKEVGGLKGHIGN